GRTYLAGKIQMRRAGHALDGDEIGESRIGINVAADDIEKIDQAAVLEAARDGEAILSIQTAVEHFIAGVPDADDEFRADACADGAQHLERETQSIIERTAVGFVQGIGERRPELLQQMSI